MGVHRHRRDCDGRGRALPLWTIGQLETRRVAGAAGFAHADPNRAGRDREPRDIAYGRGGDTGPSRDCGCDRAAPRNANSPTGRDASHSTRCYSTRGGNRHAHGRAIFNCGRQTERHGQCVGHWRRGPHRNGAAIPDADAEPGSDANRSAAYADVSRDCDSLAHRDSPTRDRDTDARVRVAARSSRTAASVTRWRPSLSPRARLLRGLRTWRGPRLRRASRRGAAGTPALP